MECVLADDVVAVEDRPGPVPRQLHRHPFRDAGADKVPGRRPAAIMEESPGHPGPSTRQACRASGGKLLRKRWASTSIRCCDERISSSRESIWRTAAGIFCGSGRVVCASTAKRARASGWTNSCPAGARSCVTDGAAGELSMLALVVPGMAGNISINPVFDIIDT